MIEYEEKCCERLWKKKKRSACAAYIRAIQDMYDGANTGVRTPEGKTKDFPVRRELNKCSTVCPCLI